MKDRMSAVAGSILLLSALAATLSCNCLCGEKPAATATMPVPAAPAAVEPDKPWNFVVAGDSRNCGDVVMPAIAAGADQNHAQFYWHLGDLRAIYDFDEDMLQASKVQKKHLTIIDYETNAWDDFIQNQTLPFGQIPFVLGIGNHETIPPKTRPEFAKKFGPFLDTPWLKKQRAEDESDAEFSKSQKSSADNERKQPSNACPSCEKDDCAGTDPQTYYHWSVQGIDFIYLDNATKCQFDQAQLDWFNAVVEKDARTDAIHTVVVGMHEALPFSISADHSMNESKHGEESGRLVYLKLLDLQKKKKVYVLASHSHFYMEDIFNTQYWRANGGVLPGWIIGTAGAQRYALPEPNVAKVAMTNVYGYLLATANAPGEQPGVITFQFKKLNESDIPSYVNNRYTSEFVHWCFANNSKAQ